MLVILTIKYRVYHQIEITKDHCKSLCLTEECLSQKSGESLFGTYRLISFSDICPMFMSIEIRFLLESLKIEVILYSKLLFNSMATPLEPPKA